MLHIINCDQCGREYATHLNTTKFCGAKCRVRAYRKRLRTNVRNKSEQKSVTQIRSEKQSAMPERKCVPGFGGMGLLKPPPTPKSAWKASRSGMDICSCPDCWHYFRVAGARRERQLCQLYKEFLSGERVGKPNKDWHTKGFDCSQWYSDMLLPHCESDALKKTPFISFEDWNDAE